MPEKKLFFVDVIPLVPFPYGMRDVFSYLAEENIPEGSLVFIPFGPRTVRGVVLSCKEIRNGKASARFKYVREVLAESFVTPEQITLAQTVSDECLTPLGRTLRHFLPTIAKERISTKKVKKDRPNRHLALSREERSVAEKLSKDRFGKPIFLKAPIGTALRILSAATKKLPKSLQALILVPEQIALSGAEKLLAAAFRYDRIAVLSSSLSPGAFFSAWERIRSGEATVILGTRQAIFAPFRALGLIAVLEESETVGYKQWDMSPRYEARRVAKTLAGIHGAHIVFSGVFPSAEAWYALEKHRDALLSTTKGVTRAPQIVNMREERYKKNFSLFSAALKDAIWSALRRKKRVLLVASRSGLDSFSICESCKTIPRCPSCDRALRSTRDGAFRCPSCSYRTKSFPRCEKCGLLSFKNLGSGTEKVAREAKRLFPTATIASHDELPSTDADILVGTASLLNFPELPEVALVAIMDADNFLSFPDFRGDERFIILSEKACASLLANGEETVLIQTFRPESPLFRSLSEGTAEAFQKNLLRDRKTLGYPPFSSIFKLILRDASEAKAEKAASHAFTLLSDAFQGSRTVRVFLPGKPLRSKIRGKYEWQIILSVQEGHSFPEKARKIILSLPKSWAFDPDPLSLI